jgi:exodeoxyribonuclease-3
MKLRIATWNINSVRLRENLVCKILKENEIDILCLQETKTQNEFFPRKNFEKMGYSQIFVRGQKSYNGVAIISRVELSEDHSIDFCSKGDARHISAKLKDDVILHNFYVPAGGDIADRDLNQKFGHKLDFLTEMNELFKARSSKKVILTGDFNIAPREDDVWSHKQLSKVVSHTPIEIKHLNKIAEDGDLIDVTRKDIPDGLLYSWWSYRSSNWEMSNKGRRLDHIWASRSLSSQLHSSKILKRARGLEKPSDHVPVLVDFEQ